MRVVRGAQLMTVTRSAARLEQRPRTITISGVRVGGIIFVVFAAFDCSLFGVFVCTIEIYLKSKRRGCAARPVAMHKLCCRAG